MDEMYHFLLQTPLSPIPSRGTMTRVKSIDGKKKNPKNGIVLV